MSNLAELERRLKEFSNQRDWQQFHTVKNLATALSIEASELQELMLWKTDEEIEQQLENEKFRNSVEEECADVFNYLTLIASTIGFDLLDVAFKKIDKNDQKYPVKKSFGNSKKYNEL